MIPHEQNGQDGHNKRCGLHFMLNSNQLVAFPQNLRLRNQQIYVCVLYPYWNHAIIRLVVGSNPFQGAFD
jgi:hypothetical protein